MISLFLSSNLLSWQGIKLIYQGLTSAWLTDSAGYKSSHLQQRQVRRRLEGTFLLPEGSHRSWKKFRSIRTPLRAGNNSLAVTQDQKKKMKMRMNLFPNRILLLGSCAEQLVSKVREVWTLSSRWRPGSSWRCGDTTSNHPTGPWMKLPSSLEWAHLMLNLLAWMLNLAAWMLVAC